MQKITIFEENNPRSLRDDIQNLIDHGNKIIDIKYAVCAYSTVDGGADQTLSFSALVVFEKRGPAF
jgi:hypothetical protein